MEQLEDKKNMAAEPVEVVVIDSLGEKDYFLQSLVDTVNSSPNNSLAITLQVGGLLVSGNMIAADTYFDKIALLYTQGTEDANKVEDIQQSIRSFGDKYRETRAKPDVEVGITTFIHLENCRIATHNQVSTFIVLWRGRISEVAGFFLGTLSVAD